MKKKHVIARIEEIQELAMWHYDPQADITDESPDDAVAHTNGIIVQKCEELIRDLRH